MGMVLALAPPWFSLKTCGATAIFLVPPESWVLSPQAPSILVVFLVFLYLALLKGSKRPFRYYFLFLPRLLKQIQGIPSPAVAPLLAT